MIRYKKRTETRKMQAGGKSPASSYSAGASAFAAANSAGDAGAHKFQPPTGVLLTDNSKESDGASKRGSRAGVSRRDNMLSKNYLKGVNLPNLTKHYNDKLKAAREKMLNMADESFNKGGAGERAMEEYSLLASNLQTSLSQKEKQFLQLQTVVKRADSPGNQLVMTGNDEVYVFGKDKKVVIIDMMDYIKDQQAVDGDGNPDRKYSAAMTISEVKGLMDSPEQYESNDNFTTMITDSAANAYSDTAAKTAVQKPPKTLSITPNKEIIEAVNGTTLNEVYNGKDKITSEIINSTLSSTPDVRKKYVQAILTGTTEQDKNFRIELYNAPTAQQNFMVEEEVKRRVWAEMVKALKGSAKTAEVTDAQRTASGIAENELKEGINSSPFLSAQFSFDNDSSYDVAFAESVLPEYEKNSKGEFVVVRKQTERGLQTNITTVQGSNGLIINSRLEMVGKGQEPSQMSFATFPSVTKFMRPNQAIFGNGTKVIGSGLHEDGDARFVPVESSPTRYTTLINAFNPSTGKSELAPWAPALLGEVQETYQRIKKETTAEYKKTHDKGIFTGRKKEDTKAEKDKEAADNKVETLAIIKLVNERMAAEYNDRIYKAYDPDGDVGIPSSYAQLTSMEYERAGYFMMDVIGVVADDEFDDNPVSKYFREPINNEKPNAKENYSVGSDEEYLTYDKIMVTTILIPTSSGVGSKTDFGKGIDLFSNAVRNQSKFSFEELLEKRDVLTELIKGLDTNKEAQ